MEAARLERARWIANCVATLLERAARFFRAMAGRHADGNEHVLPAPSLDTMSGTA